MPSPVALGSFIEALAQAADLAPDDRTAIAALPVKVRVLDAGSYTVREGEASSTNRIILLRGFACRQKFSAFGSRQIVALLFPGDIIDFQSQFLKVADHHVQTLTRAAIAYIPRADFESLLSDHPRVKIAVGVASHIEASISREWMLDVGRRDAKQRMAHLLCELMCRLGARGLASGTGFDLPVTQEQFADILGLSATHVNRTLSTLKIEGLIQQDGKRVAFPDWSALCKVGDFNARYLHLETRSRAEIRA